MTAERSTVDKSVADVTDGLRFMHDRFRYDETVKAINTGTLIQTPRSAAPGGRQYLRELVNPNIQQAAPQVSERCLRSGRIFTLRIFSDMISFVCVPKGAIYLLFHIWIGVRGLILPQYF